ncbi:MAG: CDP-diacylglycerol--glycerol-3-phosphate 3-phosphatidyltransferase, partial [Desulfovibrio sp.]|nr:CDP-diacylglycerol--glycerol-3-phosphate 3-phosphatidyltransferase [Desulfovibrio sp.]
LVMLGWAPAWVVIVIVSRELIVTGLRTIAIDEGIVLAADRYGKLKTVLQMLASVPLMLHYPLWGVDMHSLGTVLLYLSMVMAVFSCWNYCRGFFAAVKDEQGRDAGN